MKGIVLLTCCGRGESMRRILKDLQNLYVNLIVILVGVFLKRDRKVWLFGAWMGERFADNPRYLYQYMFDRKEELGLKRVIWVTRNPKVLTILNDFGYEAYDMKSKQSYYWHLRAGVHVICNMSSQTGKYQGDIIGELSAGAIKIQLWHGVGIKACYNLVSDKRRNNNKIRRQVKRIVFSPLLFGNPLYSAGLWDNRYQVTTSEENSRVAILDLGVRAKRIIECNYPRENDDIKQMPDEMIIIQDLIDKKNTKKAVLYCPTFREMSREESQYQNPLDSLGFVDYLKENDILWIEKRHSASTYTFNKEQNSNVYYIDGGFDINLLYRYADLLITDYSSAASDMIYRRKKTLSFIPDYDQYEEFERGFVNDYHKYYPCECAKTMEELKSMILHTLSDNYFDKEMRLRYDECRKFLFNDSPCELSWIYEKIIQGIM